jgi:drug/metabolite transporter (DMT)-like permease
MTIEPAAHVRTFGLVEIFFSAIISRRLFSERLTRREIVGMLMLTFALAIVTLAR